MSAAAKPQTLSATERKQLVAAGLFNNDIDEALVADPDSLVIFRASAASREEALAELRDRILRTMYMGPDAAGAAAEVEEGAAEAAAPESEGVAEGAEMCVGGPETWEELVGMPAADVVALISSNNCGLTVEAVDASSMVTMDLREDRVRVFFDQASGKVVAAPKTG